MANKKATKKVKGALKGAKKKASKNIGKLQKAVNAKVDSSAISKNASKAMESGTQRVERWIAAGEKEFDTISKDLESDKGKLDKEMKRRGLDYNEVGGIIAIVVGIFLVLMNLTGLVLGLAGLFLVYFGFKMLDRPIRVKR